MPVMGVGAHLHAPVGGACGERGRTLLVIHVMSTSPTQAIGHPTVGAVPGAPLDALVVREDKCGVPEVRDIHSHQYIINEK